jgi:hypothetical protein
MQLNPAVVALAVLVQRFTPTDPGVAPPGGTLIAQHTSLLL